MSKIYSKYLEIKSNNLGQENTLYVFKSGIFFIFIAEDAIKASSLLGLKLSNLNDTVLKCAFPTTSFEKYEKLLENSGYKLQIADANKSNTQTSNNYIGNVKVKNIMDQILETDIETLSVSGAYSLLSHVKSTFSEIAESGENHGE